MYILDDGYTVFCWVGLGASVGERKKALNSAMEYLVKYKRPLETPIVRVMEGVSPGLINNFHSLIVDQSFLFAPFVPVRGVAGGENETFEAAFEYGVKDGQTRSKAAAGSAQAEYAVFLLGTVCLPLISLFFFCC